ncbi:MAG: magnesium/cobalt transporter CorA [Nanoarchaeota archaeon]
MISSIAYRAKKTERDIPVKEYRKVISRKSNILWIDINNPSKEELSILTDVFGFHPLAVEDAHRVVELPKVDDYGSYLFVVFHKIDMTSKGSLRIKEINFFLGKNFLITIHNNNDEIFEHSKDELLKNEKNFRPEYIMHSVMDKVIDNYFPILDYWDEEIAKIEEKITEGKTEGILKKIMKLKRQLSRFRKSLNPQRDLISKLASSHYELIPEKAKWYFKDVYDHVFRIYSTLEHQNDMITVVFDAYLSNISVSLTEKSNELNNIMKNLTLVATIFMPLTFIASVYGMNFEYMPELGYKYAYFIVLALMIAIALVLFLIFRKKKLL